MGGFRGKEGKGYIFEGSITLTNISLNECTHQFLSSFLDNMVRGTENASLLDARVDVRLMQLWRVGLGGRT